MRFYFLIISSITREGKFEPREARTGADKSHNHGVHVAVRGMDGWRQKPNVYGAIIFLMVSPVVKNGLLYQSKGVIRARRRGYDPGSPGKIQFGDNFGIWDRVTAVRTVTYRERR